MGLFSKKQPEIGDPIFTDMRIAEEQLPSEIRQYLNEQMWFMGYPDKLSEWAVSTLGIDNDPKVQIMPQEGQRSDVKRGKTVRPILIPSDLLKALATNEDPHNLVFEFKEWERTRCNVMGQYCFHFLAEVMEKEGVTERDFPATNRIVHLEGKQKTPAPDSARAFCNARRSQVNEGSLTRNEI